MAQTRDELVNQLLQVVTKLGEQLVAPKVSEAAQPDAMDKITQAAKSTLDCEYKVVGNESFRACSPRVMLLPKPRDPGFDPTDYTRGEAVGAAYVAIERGDLRMLKMIVNAYELTTGDLKSPSESVGKAVKCGYWDVVRYLRKEVGFTIPKTGEEVLDDMKHACTIPSIFGYA